MLVLVVRRGKGMFGGMTENAGVWVKYLNGINS